MKTSMFVLMIVSCIWMAEKTMMTVTSVTCLARRTRIKKLPNKVLCYFSLILTLLRMYKTSKITKNMDWHDEHRVKDGVLRHLADTKAWKEFDKKYL